MSGIRSSRVTRRWDDALSRIQWQVLEELLARYYRDAGFEVEHTGTGHTGGRTDGGIDLKLRKESQYLVLECKHWNTHQVPHNDVHELLGIMTTERATGAIFVTSGEFSDAAVRRMAGITTLQMIDGNQLRAMLGHLLPEDRPHWVPPPQARRGAGRPGAHWDARAKREGITLLIKIGLAVMMVWGGKHYLEGVFRAVGQQPSRTAAQMTPQQQGDLKPVAAAPQPMPRVAPSSYPAHTPAPMRTAEQDAAAMREWIRRNEESMKLLESTPEM